MKKIKVLELIEGDFLGGGQKNALSIARNLKKDEFEVVIAAKSGGNFEQEVLKNNIKFLDIDMPKFLRTRYLKKLKQYQESEQFDIIHAHGGIAGFYGRVLKRRIPDIKTVHTIHGIHYINSESFFIHHTSKAIEQYLVQFTDMTICVNETDLNKAIHLKIADLARSTIVHTGIDVKLFSDRPADHKLKKSIGLSENDFVVGNVSRFDVQKNQKLVVQAAYYLVKKFPDMKFVFVGDGDQIGRIKDYVFESDLKDNFIFIGEVSDVENYYPLFNVFVFPTLWEGLPAVLLEAMAAHVPVICSNLPELKTVVKNNYSALLINQNIPDDLINKLSVLYRNKELREQLAANAFTEVQQFDESVAVKKIEMVYRGVLAN